MLASECIRLRSTQFEGLPRLHHHQSSTASSPVQVQSGLDAECEPAELLLRAFARSKSGDEKV